MIKRGGGGGEVGGGGGGGIGGGWNLEWKNQRPKVVGGATP